MTAGVTRSSAAAAGSTSPPPRMKIRLQPCLVAIVFFFDMSSMSRSKQLYPTFVHRHGSVMLGGAASIGRVPARLAAGQCGRRHSVGRPAPSGHRVDARTRYACVCVCVYARARATETGNAVWVDATETATERSVFKNGNNANVKTFTHGNCVGALCAGWRLFGACAPGKEMAGTSAVCVFEWPYVRMLSGSLTRARAREPRQRTAAQWGRHLPSSSRSWRPCTLRAGPCAPPSPPPSALHGALPVPEGHQLIARRTGGCDREAGAGTWCRQVAGGELCRGVAEQ